MTVRPGLPDYDRAERFPAHVWRAVEATRSGGFALACVPEVGRMLQLFAGLAGVNRAGEIGTAYGVGAAWIESGLRPGADLFTVELDAQRAASARELFAGSRAVHAVQGDWTLLADHGPFDLLFPDGGPKRNPGDPERLLPLVRRGGVLVLDDFTPGSTPDASRDLWLSNPSYRAQEVQVSSAMSVILAVRL